MEASSLELESVLEPAFRARSNTWPLPRPDEYNVSTGPSNDAPEKMVSPGSSLPTGALASLELGASAVPPKKNAARRNAWGNMSYADLITQAIQSSPEGRLTLSQIYEWMVQNVPYFKDKGDNNSSAGWKNSIRHNLSLHNRFMRVQNEGTGKSSWWVINPDAKPGKCARRRAGSMDTQKMEKKRGRVKKKMDALRNGPDATPSPSSSVSENLDMFPDSPPLHHGFQLSPDFRPRASSNASSCSRLSPIPSAESDLRDTQVSPGTIPWHSPEPPPASALYSGTPTHGNAQASQVDAYSTEQLASMAETSLKLGSSTMDSGYMEDYDVKPTIINGQAVTNTNGIFALSYQNYGTQPEYKPFSTPPSSDRSTPTLTTLQSNSSSLNDHTFSLTTLSSNQPLMMGSFTSSQIPFTRTSSHRFMSTESSRREFVNATSLACTGTHVRGHLFALNNPMPNDVDFDTIQGGLECDVNQVIQHELTVEGNLDFNFDGSSLNSTSARPWVH